MRQRFRIAPRPHEIQKISPTPQTSPTLGPGDRSQKRKRAAALSSAARYLVAILQKPDIFRAIVGFAPPRGALLRTAFVTPNPNERPRNPASSAFTTSIPSMSAISR